MGEATSIRIKKEYLKKIKEYKVRFYKEKYNLDESVIRKISIGKFLVDICEAYFDGGKNDGGSN